MGKLGEMEFKVFDTFQYSSEWQLSKLSRTYITSAGVVNWGLAF